MLTESALFYLRFLLQVLADKVHIKALTIAQRVTLLQQGLHDTSGTEVFVMPNWLLSLFFLTSVIASEFLSTLVDVVYLGQLKND